MRLCFQFIFSNSQKTPYGQRLATICTVIIKLWWWIMNYLCAYMLFSSTGYVAGFVDPEVSNRSDLFDVYVNLPDSVITISQNAKGTVCSKEKSSKFERALCYPWASRTAFPSNWCQNLTTEAMAMGKLHKDVGQLIVQSAEDADRSDSQVIKVRIHKCVSISLTAVRFVVWNHDNHLLIHRIFPSRQKRSFPT